LFAVGWNLLLFLVFVFVFFGLGGDLALLECGDDFALFFFLGVGQGVVLLFGLVVV
jgi:hypothetical protein